MDLIGFFKRNWYVMVLTLLLVGALLFVGTAINRQLPNRFNIKAAATVMGIFGLVLIVFGLIGWIIMNHQRSFGKRS